MPQSMSEKMCEITLGLARQNPPSASIADTRALLIKLMKNGGVKTDSLCEEGCNLGFYLSSHADVRYLQAAKDLGVDFARLNDKGESAVFYLFGAAPLFYMVSECTTPLQCLDFMLAEDLSLNHCNARGQTAIFGLHKLLDDNGMFTQVITQDIRSLTAADGPEYIGHYENLLDCAVSKGADLTHKDNTGLYFIESADSKMEPLLSLFWHWRNRIEHLVLHKELENTTGAHHSRRM